MKGERQYFGSYLIFTESINAQLNFGKHYTSNVIGYLIWNITVQPRRKIWSITVHQHIILVGNETDKKIKMQLVRPGRLYYRAERSRIPRIFVKTKQKRFCRKELGRGRRTWAVLLSKYVRYMLCLSEGAM